MEEKTEYVVKTPCKDILLKDFSFVQSDVFLWKTKSCYVSQDQLSSLSKLFYQYLYREWE